MKDIRIDDDGELRCWNCGSKGLLPKRTARSKVAFGVGAIVTKKKLKCMVCGEYNDTGSAKPYEGPASEKYRKQAEPNPPTGRKTPSPAEESRRQTSSERSTKDGPRESATGSPPDQAQQVHPIAGEYTGKDGRLVVEENGDLIFHFKGFWAVHKRSASPQAIPRSRVRGAELVPQKGLTDAYFRVFVEGEPEPEGKFKPDRGLSTLLLKDSQIQALRPLADELSQEESSPRTGRKTPSPAEESRRQTSSERSTKDGPRESATGSPPDQAQQVHPIAGEYTSKDGRSLHKEDAEAFVGAGREQLGASKSASAPATPVAPAQAAPDPAEQLKKLGELHAAGILTDEEFSTKKTEILGRM